jgi:hypothetical protein
MENAPKPSVLHLFSEWLLGSLMRSQRDVDPEVSQTGRVPRGVEI